VPLFSDRFYAKGYIPQYEESCQLLTKAGLNPPQDETVIVHVHMAFQKNYQNIFTTSRNGLY
jgi:hypothetical protein